MSAAISSDRPTGRVPAILMSFLFAVIVLGPVAWALATSFKTEVEAVAVPPTLWPRAATLENYFKVFRDQSFLQDFWNSVAYAVGAVALALLVGIPAGYAAARFTFKGKRVHCERTTGAQMSATRTQVVANSAGANLLGETLDTHGGSRWAPYFWFAPAILILFLVTLGPRSGRSLLPRLWPHPS